MSFLKDILPIFKKHTLTFVERKLETGDIMTFLFKSDKKLDWKSGQHGMISVKTASGKVKGKAFSIASTPDEEYIMVTTRVPENPSEYKRALLELKPGESITMRGPIGPFYLEGGSKPAVFIAGGVGITPVRAVVMNSVEGSHATSVPLEILYVDSVGQFLYKDEFNSISDKNASVKVKYLDDRNQLSAELEAYINRMGNNSYYFVSGSGTMVKKVKQALKQKNISRKNIKSDIFFGIQ
jgi:ferredoxin-NADP reductase